MELSRKTIDTLQKPQLKGMAGGDAMCGRVAGIIEERASSMLQSMRI